MAAADETPEHASIAAGAGVGAVHVGVTDGDRALAFYRDAVGLTHLGAEDGAIRLGVDGKDLVVLHPGAERAVPAHTTGLYHLALVLPSRKELARVIARLIQLRVPNSPTDHTMTKSDYLWDFDGNGIEIYCESPEDGTWTFKDGEFGAVDNAGNMRSGRDPIDLTELMTHLQPGERLDQPLPSGTHMGHVHLHIRNVEEAVHFYSDLVGFDVQGNAPKWGVAFVSAGGYHHHLGLNTWAGQGAPPAPREASGLRHYTIEVPTDADLSSVVDRLRSEGAGLSEASDGWFVSDPSSNRVHLKIR